MTQPTELAPLSAALIVHWDSGPHVSIGEWMAIIERHFWGEPYPMCEDYWAKRLERIKGKLAEYGFTGPQCVADLRESGRGRLTNPLPASTK